MRVALAAWAGMGNIGDDWLLETALASVGSQVSAVLLEPQADVPACVPPGATVLRWPRLNGAQALRSVRDFRRHVAESCDAVLFCGGGWLAGDQGARTPARWAARTRLLPVPCAGYGLGLGPFNGRGQAILARQSLDAMVAFSVRADADAAWAESLGRPRPVVVGDPTFVHDQREHGDGAVRGIAVAMPAPSQHWLAASREDEYADAVIRTAQALAGDEPCTFYSFDSSRDVAFWSSRVTIHSPDSVDGFMADARRHRAVIAGRFHAAVAAVLAGRPVVAFGYHHKFEALHRFGVRAAPIASLLDPRAAPPEPIEGTTGPHVRAGIEDQLAEALASLERHGGG